MEGSAEGVYITELIGQGVNPVTGDYSRGASGFLIKDGIVAGPIAEFTIAGNLIDMFAALTPASDLEFRHGTNAPTLRIDGMTVASSKRHGRMPATNLEARNAATRPEERRVGKEGDKTGSSRWAQSREK